MCLSIWQYFFEICFTWARNCEVGVVWRINYLQVQFIAGCYPSNCHIQQNLRRQLQRRNPKFAWQFYLCAYLERHHRHKRVINSRSTILKLSNIFVFFNGFQTFGFLLEASHRLTRKFRGPIEKLSGIMGTRIGNPINQKGQLRPFALWGTSSSLGLIR